MHARFRSIQSNILFTFNRPPYRIVQFLSVITSLKICGMHTHVVMLLPKSTFVYCCGNIRLIKICCNTNFVKSTRKPVARCPVAASDGFHMEHTKCVRYGNLLQFTYICFVLHYTIVQRMVCELPG